MSRTLALALICLFTILLAVADETRYSYDKNGRLTRVEYSDGRAIVYTYDAAGNLVRREFVAPKPVASAASAASRRAVQNRDR